MSSNTENNATTIPKERLSKIFARMQELNIAVAMCEYDGSADSGAIEEITAQTASGESVNIPDDLIEEIEEYTYDILGSHFAGWEINDGSHGYVHLNSEERTVEFEHNWRSVYTDSHSDHA